MSAPIYRDPVTDGATDPVIIEGPAGEWRMLYTQRRPGAPEPGVGWVHGSAIGTAVSRDGGASWQYAGVLDGLSEQLGAAGLGAGIHTLWAPAIVRDAGTYHLFVTAIAGVPTSWHGHARTIERFTSTDLNTWHHEGRVPLPSDLVIDAAVARCPDGRWRLWCKDEAAGSTTAVAVSDDLVDWSPEGVAIDGQPHEGPVAFALGGWWWMLTDEWRGLRVHRSSDARSWSPRGLVLAAAGEHADDRQVARHADVVVRGDAAFVVYFTHPAWDGSEIAEVDAGDVELQRSAIHVARAVVVDDDLLVERNVPARLPLA
ncbi:hypothetical protein [Microcella sp.]|uniref:hypothetical protein n=1 Tax=Microcella sp. TaxID=1913979 RepID=UPI00256475FF|nr:hypothetical protein [Microcella sp.]MBX9472499.1 hypothetical protein [Microcella sp.]